MQTAEEFLDKRMFEKNPLSIPETMIEFAKLHVQEALKAASEIDLDCRCDSWESCRNQFPKEEVINAYDLSNIK